MQNLAFKAYGQIETRTANDKQLEYALFQQITQSLDIVAQTEAPSPSVWADAISRNLQMWTLITTDLLHPENGLLDETKNSLIHIGEFVRQSSMQLLAGNGDIFELVDINRTIMAGLSGSGAVAVHEDVV